MCAQSQLSDFDRSSSQTRLGAERRPWLTAREAAQYLNVKVRGTNGNSIDALYEVVHEEGEWKINGVVARSDPSML